MRDHIWKRVKKPLPSYDIFGGASIEIVLVCDTCGLETEEVMPGVPNMNGAREVNPDCDEAVVEKVMGS